MKRRTTQGRTAWIVLATACLVLLAIGAAFAPEHVAEYDWENRYAMPWQSPPFGTNGDGVPLLDYAFQGARIVFLPALFSGFIVMFFATIAGLSRCADIPALDTALQAFSELVGALPRFVVVLVVAVAIPKEMRGLLPVGLARALLASPGAMDEAAATAGRLGGAHFVEALRAHGFSAFRIFGYHVSWLNLRPVIVRQGAEVMMQVVFLEIALSYLARATDNPSFTHQDWTHSWAYLLYEGYTALVAERAMYHSLGLGLFFVALIAVLALAVRKAAGAR